jgi:RNA polymerase sigma factor (sigma-70 family)
MKQREIHVETVEDVELVEGNTIDLVARAKTGDRLALEALLERYRPLLFDNISNLESRLKGSTLEGEDLGQEAVKIAIELVGEYEPGKVSFGAYLKHKLHWRLVNYVRRERKKSGRLVILDEGIKDGLVEEMRAKASLEVRNPRLRAAMKDLSPRQRSVLFKLYWEEKTAAQTASDLNVAGKSVQSLRRRAERQIKKSYVRNSADQSQRC